MTSPNIVLIVMDTARSVEVGIGSGPETMPFLDGLADNGTTFPAARANAPWTLPSHATLFSGELTTDHRTHAGHLTFDSSETLASRLAAAGYRTTGISNNTWVSSEFGFDTGFDKFVATWKLFQNGAEFGGVAQTRFGLGDKLRGVAEKWTGNPLKNLANLMFGRFVRRRRDDGARRTNQLVRKGLSDDDDRPQFLFVNYLEPHLPYDPPDAYVEAWLPDEASVSDARDVNQDAWAYITGEVSMNNRDFALLRALYRGELAYLDVRLSELYELFQRQADRETVFLVVGDHGENIGDHGLMDHQYSLAESLLSVPLVIAGGPFSTGACVETPVQLADVYPTLVDIATGDVPSDGAGTSMVKFQDLDDDRPLFAEYVTPQPALDTLRGRYEVSRDIEQFDRALQAVRQGRFKFVRDSAGEEWLYDLDKAPQGTQDVADNHRDVVASLRGRLDDRLGAPRVGTRDDAELDARTNERLEDLGYLR